MTNHEGSGKYDWFAADLLNIAKLVNDQCQGIIAVTHTAENIDLLLVQTPGGF
jgi:hypothetical protein